MIKISSLARCLLLCTFLLFSASLLIMRTSAFLEPASDGTDPSKDSPASINILQVYLTNNGTHFQFMIKCRSAPTPNPATIYRVFLDTKEDGATSGTYIGADYCLEAKDDTYLYEWDGNAWTQKSPIKIQIDHDDKKIFLTAKLDDIGYPGYVENSIGIVVETIQPLSNQRDRAPDDGNYAVIHEVIPELPWPTPLVFIPAVGATIYVLYSRGFRKK